MADQLSHSAYAVLTELAAGGFRSGQWLADRLGVSRTAVWQAVQALNLFGIEVDAVQGKGYRLTRPLELLEYNAFRTYLSPAIDVALGRVFIFPSIDSTNEFLKGKAQSENVHGWVCAAEMQTQGRGRRGRDWVSPFAANLYFSVGWRFTGGLDAIVGLSTAVAVLVLQALEDIGAEPLGLKWPNDIIWQNKKLSGVLIEASGESGGDCQTIIGIGINHAMPPDQPIDQAWTDLHSITGQPPSRNRLLAAVVNKLFKGLEMFSRTGLTTFLPLWRQYDILQGCDVIVESAGEVIQGNASGIDEFGALHVLTPGGRRRFHQGEVSVRPNSL